MMITMCNVAHQLCNLRMALKNGKPPGSTEVRAGGLVLPDVAHLAVLF